MGEEQSTQETGEGLQELLAGLLAFHIFRFFGMLVNFFHHVFLFRNNGIL